MISLKTIIITTTESHKDILPLEERQHWLCHPKSGEIYLFGLLMFGHNKHQQHIKKCLKRYLKKQGRVSFELKDLIELLKLPQNFDRLSNILRQIQTLPHIFKILILINRLLLDRVKCESVISQLLGRLEWSAKGEVELILEKKLIMPYKLFLQKRAVSKISSYYGQTPTEREVRVYQLINLLTMGTCFTDVIYTFGRYYLADYGCAVDFNMAIGADLQLIYKNMVDNVVRPASRAILWEIEVLHEKLYVVFYNCYFHKYLKRYIPKWVITDIPASPRKDTTKSTRPNSTSKMTPSISSKNRSVSSLSKKLAYSSSSSNMSDSCFFLSGNPNMQQQVENAEVQEVNEQSKNEVNKYEQRFLLLKSMERVVSMFNS